MKMMHLICAGALALALTACDSLPKQATDEGSVIKTVKKVDGSVETIENLSDYAIYAKRAGESKPMFEMTCPVQGCVLSSLKVNAPESGSKLAEPPKTMGARIADGFFSLGNNILDKAGGIAPWYFGAEVLKKGFDKANSSVDNSNRSVDNSNRSVNNDTSNRSTNTDNSNRSTDNSNRSTNNINCASGTPTGTTGQTGSSGAINCANK